MLEKTLGKEVFNMFDISTLNAKDTFASTPLLSLLEVRMVALLVPRQWCKDTEAGGEEGRRQEPEEEGKVESSP